MAKLKWITKEPGQLVAVGTVFSIRYQSDQNLKFNLYQGDLLVSAGSTLQIAKDDAERRLGELIEMDMAEWPT